MCVDIVPTPKVAIFQWKTTACSMASVHNRKTAEKTAKYNEKEKIDTLVIAADGPREHI
jgi:hypothetical protein